MFGRGVNKSIGRHPAVFTGTVGLGDGLNKIGKNTLICLREPSLGPCFGMKGGAAGGGKSYAMLVDPLRYAHRKAHRALILRRSMPELRELIDKSRELYPQAFPGAKFREVEKLWNFPSGAKIEFGFLERDADVYRYQGQAYSWIGFDEITHLPTEFSWNYLASRLRTTDSEIETYLRCTANPGGVGSHWVKQRYIEPYEPNKSFKGKDGLSRKFIPAKLSDNPYLATVSYTHLTLPTILLV